MNCLKPLIKFCSKELASSYGHKRFVSYKFFKYKYELDNLVNKNYVQVLPCNECDNCYSYKRLLWVERLKHESSYWKYTYFVTLTYNDNHLFSNELNKKDLQNFIKYLRRYLSFEQENLKFFATGEYGSKNQRPHFHVCLFMNKQLNLFPLNNKSNLYTCPFLSKCWKNKGFISVGYDKLGSSFGYTFNYSTKSLTKKVFNSKKRDFEKKKKELIKEHGNSYLTYLKIHDLFISYDFKVPEFIVMSQSLGYRGNDFINNQTKQELINNSAKFNKQLLNYFDYKSFYNIDLSTGELFKNQKQFLKTRALTVTSPNNSEKLLFSWASDFNKLRQVKVFNFLNNKYLGLSDKISFNNKKIKISKVKGVL